MLMHSGSYYLPAGGYITNDLKKRRADAGLDGDGTSSAPQLPDLPTTFPDTWLAVYGSNTACTWEFQTPDDAVTTMVIE